MQHSNFVTERNQLNQSIFIHSRKGNPQQCVATLDRILIPCQAQIFSQACFLPLEEFEERLFLKLQPLSAQASIGNCLAPLSSMTRLHLTITIKSFANWKHASLLRSTSNSLINWITKQVLLLSFLFRFSCMMDKLASSRSQNLKTNAFLFCCDFLQKISLGNFLL